MSNVAERVIMSNQSLVLQRVERGRSGRYSCTAFNNEGSQESRQLPLKIKCELFFHFSSLRHSRFLLVMMSHVRKLH